MSLKFDKWSSLDYWHSGEWQVIEERLQDELKAGRSYVPSRSKLFRALDLVGPGEVRCVVVGQDPYPTADCATGVAFSVPEDRRQALLPPTLKNIFKEYQSDLRYPAPKNGDLTSWCEQGVLLWNAYPSCMIGSPGSHHWDEWTYLTKEIMEKLSERKNIVFIFLGNSARSFAKHVRHIFDGSVHISNNLNPLSAPGFNAVIETSHPSPLGAKHGFLGSQIFTRANFELKRFGQQEINWRLSDGCIPEMEDVRKKE